MNGLFGQYENRLYDEFCNYVASNRTPCDYQDLKYEVIRFLSLTPSKVKGHILHISKVYTYIAELVAEMDKKLDEFGEVETPHITRFFYDMDSIEYAHIMPYLK